MGNDPNVGLGGARPTMRDVAALAGVGVMTVSRVVNGRGGVGPDRAARVWHAIEKLDYRHNVTARHLRLTGQPTATIAVLLEDVANPFAAELLRAVEDVVSEQDWLVLCASSDGDAARERALLGDLRRIYTAAERYRGYLEALRAGGIEPDERLIRRDVHSQPSAVQATRDLFRSAPAPTAIFTAQNLLTIGARMALRSLDAERRIAHVGFDEIPLGELLDPGITVVAQDPPALGTLAAQLLLHRIANPGGAPETVEVPVRLITRGSAEIPPSPDSAGAGGPGQQQG